MCEAWCLDGICFMVYALWICIVRMWEHSSRDGNGKDVDIDVQKYLRAAGIFQVVSGHQVCVCVNVCARMRVCKLCA
jgi:hypothetical protein